MTATATTALVPSSQHSTTPSGSRSPGPGRVPRPDKRGLRPGPAPVTTWRRIRSLRLFSVRRADIESFARDLEARGRARATVTRRLCTIAGFYRYAVEEELLEHSRLHRTCRPRVDYESHAVALDRNELGALLVAAGLGPATEHALISLLALNGLRVSEAVGADIEGVAQVGWQGSCGGQDMLAGADLDGAVTAGG